VGALDVNLSAEDLVAIEQVAPKGVVSGERYAKDQMKRINV
jgi:hypothetical protein